MDEPEQLRSHVDSVRDQTDGDPRRVEIEHAPEDVVVAIQLLGTSVSEVRECCGTCIDGLAESGGRGVGVSQADHDAQRSRGVDGGHGTAAFGRHRDHEGQRTRSVAEPLEIHGLGITHPGRVVRPVKPRFFREKRAFDMPTEDHLAELRTGRDDSAQVIQSREQTRPFVGDQREQETVAAVAPPGARGDQEIALRDPVALEVDPGVAVHLRIEDRWADRMHGGRREMYRYRVDPC